MSAILQRFHQVANDALVTVSENCLPGAKIAMVIYTPGKPEEDIILKDQGLDEDEVLSSLRRRGLSIDGDNAYKRDLCDSIVGALAMGAHNVNPPPANHWGQRFWDIGREERELHEELVVALKLTLSHVFNMAREWGLTTQENPCQGVRKNKETPRDYYANDAVWAAVYKKAAPELKDAMDLAYLTGQRPADVLIMRRDDIEGEYLLVQQNKTNKRLRIQINTDGLINSLGKLVSQIAERNAQHVSSYLIVSSRGKRMTATMLRKRWDEARDKARAEAIERGDALLAGRIAEFQFRDIRPKAASEIKDIGEASLLLGHTKGDITERVYRRIGAIAKPSK